MDSFEAMRKLAMTLGVASPESNDNIFDVSFINTLTRFAKGNKVDWETNDKITTLPEGEYWVHTPNGVEMATYHHWGYKFQSRSGDDEGMCGFEVTHYQPIIKPMAI